MRCFAFTLLTFLFMIAVQAGASNRCENLFLTESIDLNVLAKEFENPYMSLDQIRDFNRRVQTHLANLRVETRITPSIADGDPAVEIVPGNSNALSKMAQFLHERGVKMQVSPTLLRGARAAFYEKEKVLILDSETVIAGHPRTSTVHEFRHAYTYATLLRPGSESILLGSVSSRHGIPHAPGGYRDRFGFDELWANIINAKNEIDSLRSRNTIVESKSDLPMVRRIVGFAKATEVAVLEALRMKDSLEVLEATDQSEMFEGVRDEKVFANLRDGSLGVNRSKERNSIAITLISTGEDRLLIQFTFSDLDHSIWKNISSNLQNPQALTTVFKGQLQNRLTNLIQLVGSLTLPIQRVESILNQAQIDPSVLDSLYAELRTIERLLGRATINQVN